MIRTPYARLASTALLCAVALTGCDDAVGVDGQASVRVLLTDAPSDYIASAEVDIGAVELIPAGEGGRVVLSDDGTDGFVDLLDLQGAATSLLAEAEIDAGEYAQLRLIVESARVTLADGYEFNDGGNERELFVPSGAQTGIKLNLAGAKGDDSDGGPVTIAPGETVLVLDFDVSQSFVIQGDPETPAGINGVLFTPTIRVTVEDAAASISGTVSTEIEGASVEGLVVTAEPVDDGTLEPYQTATGTAVTDAEGNFTVYFLVPGEYTVTVDAGEGLTTDPASATVGLDEGEDETDVDFVLVESGS